MKDCERRKTVQRKEREEMENFNFYAGTEMIFGKDAVKGLPEVLDRFGKKVLLGYGGGSIKRTGIYDTIKKLLDENGFEVYELDGIEPNPRITSVDRGAKLCKEHGIDVILAAGGGSTIDCCKAVAAAAYYDGNPWDLVCDNSLVEKALPIVTVLTMAATGSEMNRNAVISNMETNEKRALININLIPQVSFCDPQYLYTLPAIQTAAGTADILSHLFENYFKNQEAYIPDEFAEGLMRACLKYCPIALKDPSDYEARANLMWASSMALNGLTNCGKSGAWSCHPIEHELSAYYDVTHGVGLAIVTPRWMRYILSDKTVDKFVQYAVNVWQMEPSEDKYALANAAIDATEQFFLDCNIPMTLPEIGIDDSKLRLMADDTAKYNNLAAAYVPMTADDVYNILVASMTMEK